MDLSLEILGDPMWSYAYAGTRRSVVKQITLNQTGTLPPADVEVFPRLTFDFPLPEDVAAPWEGARRTLESRGQRIGESITWSRVELELNYLLLARLRERVEGKVRVDILETDTGSVLLSETKSLSLLAPNQWQFEPHFHEVMAAFVLPSDPYVHEILRRARELLDQRTGDSSTEGYQSEVPPEIDDRPLRERSRAYKIANAIYDAMSSMGYAYSNPPGLFDGGAQRVRTPSQVRDEHCATCLDSTVLMAACFAQAGLEPVIFLVRGHAYAGYFTGAPIKDAAGQLVPHGGGSVFGEHAVDHWNDKLSSALRLGTDLGALQYLIHGGHVQPVETTSTTSGLTRPFVEACARGVDFSPSSDEALQTMVLVGNAWRSGITPPVSLADVPLHALAGHLPRREGDARHDTNAVPVWSDEPPPDVEMSAEERATPPRVRQWLASLLDLSSRNPLLKVKSSQVMEFDLPAELLGEVDDALFTPKKRIEVVSPAALPFEWVLEGVTPEEFGDWMKRSVRLVYPDFKRLNGIQRSAENFLAAARGEVGDPIRGLPAAAERHVETIRANRHHPYHRMSDAEIVQGLRNNQLESLAEELKVAVGKLQTKAKESMLTTGTNALYLALGTVTWTESSDFRGTRKATEWRAPLYLYPVILEGGKGSPFTIRLDPNADHTPNYCLHEKLKRPPYNLDLQELVNPAADDKGLDLNLMIAAVQRRLNHARLDNFAVLPSAALGVFDYSTFRLWKDLKDSWKLMSDISPSVKHLMFTPNIPFTGDPPPPVPRLEPYMPIAADDSQREAVQWALDGRAFRLEGPPGTGKSQTITNLLASCIANNKKVLFVAEKQTALNAVKDRLEDAGLGSFCLNLHAKGDSDTRLRRNISGALTTALAHSIDPDDSAWSNLQVRIGREREVLDRYRDSLHGAANTMSVWSMNEERIGLGSGDIVDLPRSFVESFQTRWPALQEVIGLIEQSIDIVGDPTTHPWRFVEGCRVPESSYAQVTGTLAMMHETCSELAAMGPEWARLIKLAGRSRLESLALAIAARAEGRLAEIRRVTRLSEAADESIARTGRDALLEEVTAECSRLASRMGVHLDTVAPQMLDDGTAARVETALAQLAGATSSPAFREVATAWTSLAGEVASHIPVPLADQLFTRPDLADLQRALAEHADPERRRQLDLFTADARLLEGKVRAHVSNVSPSLLGRSDLVNVTLLVGDAESAGMLSRKKKMSVLRDLLASDAATENDRLLLHSLKELLALAPEATALRERAVRTFPEAEADGLRPWVPAELDEFVRAVRGARLRRLAETAHLTGAPTDEAILVRALQSALDIAPRARQCAELLRSNLPEEATTPYRPWDPTELHRLSNSVIARHTELVHSSVGTHALSTDPECVAAAAHAWLAARPEIDQLRQKVASDLCPVQPLAFRPWAADDIAQLVSTRKDMLAIGALLRDADLAASFEAATQALPTYREAQLVRDLASAVTSLHECFDIGAEPWRIWLGDRTLVEAAATDFPALLRDGGENHRFLELTRWLGLMSAVKRLAEVGLGDLRPLFMSGTKPIEEVEALIRRSAIFMALRMRLEDGNLDRFDRKVHERRIQAFETALKDSQQLLTKRIPGLVNRRRKERQLPTGSEGGATQALLRGLRPGRGERTPIRELISKYGNALADAMPCFLMSPDSVATLLPVGSIVFDVVVFDEASQVRTSHAVGALGRGKAGIVVGDSRQMPPSNAFSSNLGAFVDDDSDDDSDDEPIDDSDLAEDGSVEALLRPAAAPDAESILTEFYDSEFPHLQLLCHYRSKDELLIAFSNTHIYETPMLTFPSIKGLDSTALRFVHVADGSFQRDKSAPPFQFENSPATIPSLRTNSREAEEVTAEVLRRLSDPVRRRRRESDPDRKAESIIVVTFNKQQMRLIEAMLRDANPDLFDEATAEGEPDEVTGKRTPPQLKIRNLESVQGDEAEVVIFSVAFSRTPKGTFPLNFGPVTNPGGDRRLNVAVTRAQREMVVFGSFLPEEMSAGGKVLSEGAQMVQRFLSLALYGPQRSADVGVEVARSRHIEEIAQALRERGHEVHTQLGLSTLRVDIAVRRPAATHWELAIMVDDRCWSERGSAFQREVLPRQVLPQLGWSNVLRVWLPSWLNEREEILAEIEAALDGSLPKASEEEPSGDGLVVDALSSTTEVATVGKITSHVEPTDSSPMRGEASPTGRPILPLTSNPVEQQQPDPEPTSFRRYVPFIPYEVRHAGDVALLDAADHDKSARQRIDDVIGRVIRAEAPIEAERLAKLVCQSLGIGRVSADRVKQVLRLVPRSIVHKDVVGSFVWPEEIQRDSWNSYRTSLDGLVREYSQISAIEYRNALVDVVEKSHRIDHAAALKEVGRIFGFIRITVSARAVMEKVFAWCVKEGHVRRDGDDYLPV